MKKLKKNPLHFVDKKEFIVTQEHDFSSRGGNSAQHTAMWIIGMYSLSRDAITSFIQAKKKIFLYWILLNKQPEPTLHWDAQHWPGQVGHMSRDNLVAFVCALKLFDLKKTLWLLLLRIALRGGFLWNYKRIGQTEGPHKIPDWCGPLIWFTALRFKWNPLNLIADLYLGIAIVIACLRSSNPKHMDQHLNLIVIGETCAKISHNIILDCVLAFYKESELPKIALTAYFEPEYAAPLDHIWIQVVERWPS
ncbi:hypothetical protein EKK58_08725 [Candidatus Dependentiae bacterium]|nr:MAG: hypothetical protein EKK58_08725 [Candidatus Dependentiae bacterium]